MYRHPWNPRHIHEELLRKIAQVENLTQCETLQSRVFGVTLSLVALKALLSAQETFDHANFTRDLNTTLLYTEQPVCINKVCECPTGFAKNNH